MGLTKLITKHLRDVYFGGNWTTSSLKDQLSDVNLEEALTKIGSINSIAVLVCHLHYYVQKVTPVLQGQPLDAADKLSFAHPPLENEKDWQELLEKFWEEAEQFALLIEKLPDDVLEKDFTNPKYGNYFRNLHGIIEHIHYHLGQIVVMKKVIREKVLS